MSVSETARRMVASTLELVPVDLALVVVYTVFASAFVGGDGSIWQFLLGLGLVLVAPGYAVVAALFPARPQRRDDRPPTTVLSLSRPHDGVLIRERLALSFGVSVVLIPLFAVLFGALGVTLTTASTLGAVWAIVGGGVIVGTVRRLALPEPERFDPLSAARRFDRPQSADTGTTLLTIALCGAVVLALGSFAVAIAGPTQTMSYTSASLLAPAANGDPVAGGYPVNVSRGESYPFVVRVDNQHDRAANYTVQAHLQRMDGGQVLVGERVWRGRQRVGANETWSANHTVTPTLAGQDLRLTYYVYRGSVPETVNSSTADKVLYLRLDVLPEGSAGRDTPQPAGTSTPRAPTGG